MESYDALALDIRRNRAEKGFYTPSQLLAGCATGTDWYLGDFDIKGADLMLGKLALVASEIDEAWDADGQEEILGELADVVIRSLDIIATIGAVPTQAIPRIGDYQCVREDWDELPSNQLLEMHQQVRKGIEATRKGNRDGLLVALGSLICLCRWVSLEWYGSSFLLDDAVEKKHAVNRDRPAKHGKVTVL